MDSGEESGLFRNKIRLTSMSLLISFTLAGISSQIGLLVNPISEAFKVEPTVAAAQFSWLNGGVLVGNILAMGAFNFFRMRNVVMVCYATLIAAASGLYVSSAFYSLALFFSVIGIAAGIGVCASSTIIAQLWQKKQRHTLLVAQDALFNSGGIVFPLVIGVLLARQFDWSWSFLTIAIVAVIILALAWFSDFNFDGRSDTKVEGGIEWPVGLTIAGISLFLALVSLVSITIWLPSYVENQFGVVPDESAGIISKIYLAALIGSLLSTIIVMKVRIQYFIAVIVSIGCISVYLFSKATSFDTITWLAYAYGLAIAALYHSFIAWGLGYVKEPNYRHVSFLYICPGVGGTVAPYLSSKIVAGSSIASVFVVCSILYGSILIAILMLSGLNKKSEAKDTGAEY